MSCFEQHLIDMIHCARRHDCAATLLFERNAKKCCKNPTKAVIKDRHIVGKKSRQVAN